MNPNLGSIARLLPTCIKSRAMEDNLIGAFNAGLISQCLNKLVVFVKQPGKCLKVPQ